MEKQCAPARAAILATDAPRHRRGLPFRLRTTSRFATLNAPEATLQFVFCAESFTSRATVYIISLFSRFGKRMHPPLREYFCRNAPPMRRQHGSPLPLQMPTPPSPRLHVPHRRRTPAAHPAEAAANFLRPSHTKQLHRARSFAIISMILDYLWGEAHDGRTRKQ